MKKIYSLLTSLFITLSAAYAQPTFTSANWPAIGTSVSSIPVDATPLTEGSAGANQTWSYPGIIGTGPANVSYLVTAASTPFAADFPTANYAVESPTTTGGTGYGYYSINSSYGDLLGIGLSSVNGTFPIVYSDPLRAMTFPYTYGTTVTDSYTGFASYIAGGYTINLYRTGNFYSQNDAYGTITTPTGTYSNSLRSYIVDQSLDSQVIVGLFTTLFFHKSVSYAWKNLNLADNIFLLTYDTIINDGIPSYAKAASFSTSSTGMNEFTSAKPLAIFPNPAINATVVHLSADEMESGETKFTATTVEGKIVKEIDFTLFAANHKTVDIDMSDVPAGLYFIQLRQKNALFSSRFLKQ
jgi:hypothetical protein